MSLGEALFDWSGWIFGFFGAVVSADSIRRTRRERRRGEQMALALSARQPVRPTITVSSQTLASEHHLRAFLVHAAAGEQPLAAAIGRAKSLGLTEHDVMEMAKELRRSGLLNYSGELSPTTPLVLKVG
jgi:hypothetical protein